MLDLADPRNWGEELPAPFALEQVSRLISRQSGIVLSVHRLASLADLPRIYEYSAELGRTRIISDAYGPNDPGSGASFYPERAKLRAIGEALERYATGIYRAHRFRWAPASDLARSENVVDLRELATVWPSKSARLQSQPLQWVSASRLSDGAPARIPGQLVYTPFRLRPQELFLRESNTSGVAAGTSLGGAMERAILELIERDAFLLTYLHGHRSPEIDWRQSADPFVPRLIDSLDFCRLELRVFDTSTDLDVPVSTAVVTDRTGRYPAVMVGAKAAWSSAAATRGAIEEAFHALPWARAVIAQRRSEIRKIRSHPERISTLEERLLFWTPPKSLEDFPLVQPGSSARRPKLGRGPERSARKDLGALIRSLHRKGIELYAVDLTLPDVAAHGFHVVRIVATQLIPLYLSEAHRAWGTSRLLDAPEHLGWPDRRRRDDRMARAPHPFL